MMEDGAVRLAGYARDVKRDTPKRTLVVVDQEE